ncbi:hypothetical protein [Pedobacter sp.]
MENRVMKTKKEAIPDFRNGVSRNPHLVILGAGASCAAFLKGDKNGRKLPVMKTLAKDLGLTEMLSPKYGDLLDDFELLYSSLYQNAEDIKLRKTVDEAVHGYFLDLKVSDEPNLYDYLILSLREKDIIATFNWDPLLLQSYLRHRKFNAHVPQLLFLHGNVGVGICRKCNISGNYYNKICHRCHRPFSKMPLLYPVGQKNYSANASIRREWTALKYAFQCAYYITIFGYSAPVTDADARKVMLDALVSNRSRVFSELEIIDIAPEEAVEENWSDFIYSHHYNIIDNFKNSDLWWHPRRSCEALASGTLMNDPIPHKPFPEFKTVEEMHEWIEPLIKEEIHHKITQKGFK